jgi:stage IV sporulation protein FB
MDANATRRSPEARAAPDSTWTLQIGTVLGIPIRIHVTFVLLLFWFGFAATSRGESPVRAVVFLLLLFACVALHELGHAAMAQRFGVRTGEIVLYPIGGIARLESIPQGTAELLIALAGPAVNVVLAALIAGLLVALGLPLVPASVAVLEGSLLHQLLAANMTLFLFNLIPAFPMDGGRVLRALLATRMTQERATTVAAAVGQAIAFAGGAIGVFTGNWVLLFIALFVFLGAGQEAAFFQQRAAVLGHTARDAMITKFETLAPQDTLERAGQLLLSTHQQDFPVIDAWNRVAGILSRTALIKGLASMGPSGAVLAAMNREWRAVEPSTALEDVLRQFQSDATMPLLVLEDGVLAGMVTLENLAEFIQISQVRRGRAAAE